jgi:hypothetical protein
MTYGAIGLKFGLGPSLKAQPLTILGICAGIHNGRKRADRNGIWLKRSR